MKRFIHTTIALSVIFLLSGCEKIFMPDDESNDPTAVFEYLWKQVDERYSLFDVKNVDWQQVHDTLYPKVDDKMTNDQLFAILRQMLNTLDDGHVNLWGSDDVASSEAIYLQRYGNSNFDVNTVALTYLRPDYHTTGGMAYNTIANGEVLYIRYSSFSSSATTGQLKKVINRFPDVKGIVFDIRQNGGGEIQNEWNLMTMLPSDNQLLYRTQMKNGPKHDDFGPAVEVRAPSNGNNSPFTKPFVLLTDRGCYSAASAFALCLKTYRNVTVMGDTTGGGLAIPSGGALPNGWYYRFGVSRVIAPDGVNYENGVPPDMVVRLDPTSVASKRDNIIDSACNFIIKLSFAGTQSTTMGFAGTQSATMSFARTQNATMCFAGTQSATMSFAGTQSATMSFAGTQSATMGFAGTQSTTMSFAGTQSATLY